MLLRSQRCASLSCTNGNKYVATNECVKAILLLRHMLNYLLPGLGSAIRNFEDSEGAMDLSMDSLSSGRTNYTDAWHHFVLYAVWEEKASFNSCHQVISMLRQSHSRCTVTICLLDIEYVKHLTPCCKGLLPLSFISMLDDIGRT